MKFAIIGFGQAGNCAARSIRANIPDAEVTIFDAEETELYAKMRLGEYVAGILAREKLILSTPQSMAELGIKVIPSTAITQCDVQNKILTAASGENHSFDKLVFATGADAFVPNIPGICFEHSFVLRTLTDAEKITSELSRGVKSCAVLGGGLLGLEAAWALRKRGLEVTVLESCPGLLPRQLNEQKGKILQAKLEETGLRFRIGVTLKNVEKNALNHTLSFESGDGLSCDMLIVSAGIRQKTNLARAAGLSVGRGITIDPAFRTSEADVYALGDCAELCGRIGGLWLTAKSQGDAIGEILAGKRESWSFPESAPSLKIPGIKLTEL